MHPIDYITAIVKKIVTKYNFNLHENAINIEFFGFFLHLQILYQQNLYFKFLLKKCFVCGAKYNLFLLSRICNDFN